MQKFWNEMLLADGEKVRLAKSQLVSAGATGMSRGMFPETIRIESLAEPPITLEALQLGIDAHPEAARIVIELLSQIESLPMDEALTRESLAYARLQGSADHAHWLKARKPVAQFPEGEIRLTREEDRLTVLISRSEAHNAINRKLRDALFEAFTLASLDPDIRQVELRSAGKAFCIGGDLAEFGTTRDPAEAHTIRMQTMPARALLGCREKLHVHVQGACIGAGLEIAAFAARVTASPKAWFQLPELAMGLIPGAGGCVSVPRRIGWKRTAALLLSGQRISAQVALDWGLVDAIEDQPEKD
jgi:enoyl-CoA hydratase/carnithine racemase